MIDINLLPWRGEVRLAYKKRKIMLSILLSFTGIIVATMMYSKQLPDETKTAITPPLMVIKWIGYIHQASHCWAILLLPDGKTQAVEAGSFLREMHLQVMSVQKKNLIVMFPNHHRIFIPPSF